MIAQESLNAINIELKLLAGTGVHCPDMHPKHITNKLRLLRAFPVSLPEEQRWLWLIIWTGVTGEGAKPKGKDAIRMLLAGPRGKIWQLTRTPRPFNKENKFDPNAMPKSFREKGIIIAALAKTCISCKEHPTSAMDLVVDREERLVWLCSTIGCKTTIVVDAELTRIIRDYTSPAFWDSKRVA